MKLRKNKDGKVTGMKLVPVKKELFERLDKVTNDRSDFINGLIERELALNPVEDVKKAEYYKGVEEVAKHEKELKKVLDPRVIEKPCGLVPESDEMHRLILETEKVQPFLDWLRSQRGKDEVGSERFDILLEAGSKRLGVPVGLLREYL